MFPSVGDEAYFRWLIDQVQEDGYHRTAYRGLFEVMHDTEFCWQIHIWGDENRVKDGEDLRVEFFGHRVRGPCSVLEVMVALSRRVAWLADGSAEGWAWQLLCNLGLHKFHDPLTERNARKVDEILYALVWRTHHSDGSGGFFPLTKPRGDQRQIEIWYQMSAYVEEIHPEY